MHAVRTERSRARDHVFTGTRARNVTRELLQGTPLSSIPTQLYGSSLQLCRCLQINVMTIEFPGSGSRPGDDLLYSSGDDGGENSLSSRSKPNRNTTVVSVLVEINSHFQK